MRKKTATPYAKELFAMEKKLAKSFQKLKTDMKSKNPNLKKIIGDYNELMLLMGEANYIARECYRFRKQKS